MKPHRATEKASPNEQVESSLTPIGSRHRALSVVYDLVAAEPYSLRFANPTDVICLLFGAIDAETTYDSGKAKEMRFEPLTAAFHPAGGDVAVDARQNRGGFVAFTYPRAFATHMFGNDLDLSRDTESAHNLTSPAISNLASYARATLCAGRDGDPLCVEALAQLAYVEAVKQIRAEKLTAPQKSLSQAELARLLDYIEANIAAPLSHANLARVVDAPIGTLRRTFRQHTGRPLHQFVLERRVEKACRLLETSNQSIVEIALACGFSSQQHMTTVFASRVGCSPSRFRNAAS